MAQRSMEVHINKTDHNLQEGERQKDVFLRVTLEKIKKSLKQIQRYSLFSPLRVSPLLAMSLLTTAIRLPKFNTH